MWQRARILFKSSFVILLIVSQPEARWTVIHPWELAPPLHTVDTASFPVFWRRWLCHTPRVYLYVKVHGCILFLVPFSSYLICSRDRIVNDLWAYSGNGTFCLSLWDSVSSTESNHNPFGQLFPVIGRGSVSKACSPLPPASSFSTSVRGCEQGTQRLFHRFLQMSESGRPVWPWCFAESHETSIFLSWKWE